MSRKKLLSSVENIEPNIPPMTEDIILEKLAEAFRKRRARLAPKEHSAKEIRSGGLVNVFVGPGPNLADVFVGPGGEIPDIFVGLGKNSEPSWLDVNVGGAKSEQSAQLPLWER